MNPNEQHLHGFISFVLTNFMAILVCAFGKPARSCKDFISHSLINTNPLSLLSKQGYERSPIPDNKLGIKRYVL